MDFTVSTKEHPVRFMLVSQSGLVILSSSSNGCDDNNASLVARLAGTMASLSPRVASFEFSVSNHIYFSLPMSPSLPFLLVITCDTYSVSRLLLIALQIRHLLWLSLSSQFAALAVTLSEQDNAQLNGSTFHDIAGSAQVSSSIDTGMELTLDVINMYFVQPVLSRNLSHNWINPVKQQLAHFNGDSPLYHFLLLLRSAYDTYERVVPLDDCGAICIPLEWVEYMNACDGSDDEWLSYSIQEEVTLIISKTNVLNVYLCATLPDNHLSSFTRAWSAMLFRFHQYHPSTPPPDISESSLSHLLDVCAPVGAEKGAIPPTAPMAPKKPPRPHARYS